MFFKWIMNLARRQLITIYEFFLFSFIHAWYRQYCFWMKFLKWIFWWIYTFWFPLNPKITFSMVCPCMSVSNITEKTNCSRNFKLSIIRFFFFLFSYVDDTWNFSYSSDKNSVYKSTQKNSNALRPMEGISF